MKKTIIAFVLCAMCAGASAQTVTVADVEALPGETVAFTLDLAGGKANTYTAVQFDVQFPATGFTTTGDYSVSSLWKNPTSTIGTVDATGMATVPVASSETISVADVPGLLSVYFTVGSDVALGEYDVTLKNFWFGYGTSSKDNLEDVTFKVKVVAVHTIVLDENSTTMPEASNGAVNVTVKRSIKANEWSTICLPFDMDETQVKAAFGDDVQLADFVDYETTEDTDENITAITVNFDSMTEIEANHPYIIKVSTDINYADGFTVEGVELDPVEEDAYVEYNNGLTGRKKVIYGTFEGTYHAQAVVPENCLFLSGNKFWYSKGLTKMKAFRGWFDFIDVLTSVEDASNVKFNFIVDGEETRIDEIANRKSSNGKCFDLSGRQITKPQQKGVYVVNGKKVIIK